MTEVSALRMPPAFQATVRGFEAHRLGHLLAQCPHPPGRLRQLWRDGWLTREESLTHITSLDLRRRGGSL